MPLKKIEAIKENIDKTNYLNDDEKSQSMKIVEEWALEDKAFGILREKLLDISVFFEELFSELGIK